MSSAADVDLLFLDTFTHAGPETDVYNIDMVQFSEPVRVTEVRVVPLGMKVAANISGGTRLGATNPSDFTLELLAENAESKGIVFDHLGSIEYKDKKQTIIRAENSIATRCVLLKGFYSAITVGIFGRVTTVAPELMSPSQSVSGSMMALRERESRDAQQREQREHREQRDREREHRDGRDRDPREMEPRREPMRDPMRDPMREIHQQPPVHILPPDVMPPEPGYPPPEWVIAEQNLKLQTSPAEPIMLSAQSIMEAHHIPQIPIQEPPPQSIPLQPMAQTGAHPVDPRDEFERQYAPRPEIDPYEHEQDFHRDPRLRKGDNFRGRPPRFWDQEYEQGRGRSPPRFSRSRSMSRSRSPSVGARSDRSNYSVEMEYEQDDDAFQQRDPRRNQSRRTMSDVEDGDDLSGYEDIVSDEELMDDIELDVEGMESLNTYSSYNPFTFELTTLQTMYDPSLTDYQLEKLKLAGNMPSDEPEEAVKIRKFVEEFGAKVHNEDWVTELESMPGLLPIGLSYIVETDPNHGTILDSLIEHALEGIDAEKAVQQPEAKFKIRHLKMGIRLVGALCCCDGWITNKLLPHGVQSTLLDLYSTENMSLAMKLKILRSLDQTMRLLPGMLWFIGHHPQQKDDSGKPTGYQRLLELIMSKQLIRAVVSMSAIVRKVHLYETLTKLRTSIEDLSRKVIEDKDYLNAKEDTDEEETKMSLALEQDLNTITALFASILKSHETALHEIGQPNRTLPATCVFQQTQKPQDPYPYLYSLYKSTQLLESVFVLLCTTAPYIHAPMFDAIKNLITEFMSCERGLLFLANNIEVMNGMIRLLTQATEENREEIPDDSSSLQLGLQLVFYLQTLMNVDALDVVYNNEREHERFTNLERAGTLNQLITMMLTSLGKDSVVAVLSQGQNLNSLMRFFEIPRDDPEKRLDKDLEKTWIGYSSYMISTVVECSEDVDILRRFSAKLIAIGKKSSSNVKLLALNDYLAPLRHLNNLGIDGLQDMMSLLKQYCDDVTDLPKGLVVVLRLLLDLSISEQVASSERPEELKHRSVLIDMFNMDSMQLFISILQKLCQLQTRPWQEGSYVSNCQGQYFMRVCGMIVQMIRATLELLVNDRGAEFKDLTPLTALFHLHSVVCSVTPGGVLNPEASKIQDDILESVNTYTQIFPSQSGEEGIGSDIWTMMLQEMLKFILSSPQSAMSGLLLLSELLPLPLPIQTKEPLSEEESSRIINARKLWTAHILCCGQELQDVLKALAPSSVSLLQQVLRRICWQVADLSVQTSTLVVKCLLDVLVERTEGRVETEAVDAHLAQVYSLLSALSSQASIKPTMLNLMGCCGETEEKYAHLFLKSLQILGENRDAVQKQSHLLAQEYVVTMMQALCDPEVTLLSSDSMSVHEQLGSALPHKEHIAALCNTLLGHLCHMDHGYGSILPALRTMVMLAIHDYGFYYLKKALDQHPDAFNSLFNRINMTFSKESSDCLSTLSTATELLHLLVTLENSDDEEPLRTYVLSVEELKKIVNWIPEEEKEHPLYELSNLLADCAKEDEALESLLDGVNNLLQDIRSSVAIEAKELVEPTLPPAEALANQFNMRPLYSIAYQDDERLTIAYWFSNEYSDAEGELIQKNLEELSRCVPDFDLKAELERSKLPGDPAALEARKKIRRMRSHRDTINTSRGGRGRRGDFVAPMRGGRGGFHQRGGPGGSRSHDLFRSRAPNTSRPPSMHVDDFVKMESQGGGHGNFSPHSGDGGFANRGRGRGGFDNDRGRGRGGRYMTPPGDRGRGGIGRGGPRGRGGPFWRGGPSFGRGTGRDDDRGRYEDRRGGFFPRGRGRFNSFRKEDRFGSPHFAPRGGRRDYNDRGRHMGHARSFTK